MATGALDANGIWQYGEDDSNTTFSALLNRLGASTSTQIASAKPSGRVLQTVSFTTTTQVSTTSTSFVTTGAEVTITPRFATSKIFIIADTFFGTQSGTVTAATIYRNSTNLGEPTSGFGFTYVVGNALENRFNMSYLDSPATTSATSYKLMFRVTAGTSYAQKYNFPGTVTVMEIAA